MGLLQRFWTPFFGVPQGPLGRLGAWLMTRKGRYFRAMAAELDLQPGDELLDVGCGSARFFADHAAHVSYVAGLDASEIQVAMARERLAQRMAAGTASASSPPSTPSSSCPTHPRRWRSCTASCAPVAGRSSPWATTARPASDRPPQAPKALGASGAGAMPTRSGW